MIQKVLLSVVLSVCLWAPQQVFAVHEGLDIRILEGKRYFSDLTYMQNPVIPQEIIQNSKALMIFPKVGKGGLFYAAKFGLGIVMARHPQTGEWGPPAFVRMSGGSFGLQAGWNQQAVILVGRDGFTFENFRGGPSFSGAGTATFGPWGVHSELGTGWQFNSQMHWFTRNNGFFASLAMDGTVWSFDEDANAAYYGQGVTPVDILFGNNIQASTTGQMLIEEIKKFEMRTPSPEIRISPNQDWKQDQHPNAYPSQTHHQNSNAAYPQSGYTQQPNYYQTGPAPNASPPNVLLPADPTYARYYQT